MHPSAQPGFGISITRNAVDFSLQDGGRTTLSLFDCLGREIMPMLDRYFPAGPHHIAFDKMKVKPGVSFLYIKHAAACAAVRIPALGK
jgi:hypothetical protein